MESSSAFRAASTSARKDRDRQANWTLIRNVVPVMVILMVMMIMVISMVMMIMMILMMF